MKHQPIVLNSFSAKTAFGHLIEKEKRWRKMG